MAAAARCASRYTRQPTEKHLLDFLLLPKAGLTLGIWSCKKLKGPWLAVYCRQNDHINDQRPNESQAHRTHDVLQPPNPINQEYVTKAGQQASKQSSQQESSTFIHQESDKVNHKDSDSITTATSSDMSGLQEPQGITGLLDDWTVDWLAFPHLTRDPWIQFLVTHDWSATAAGPMHTWHPTLRQVYSIILASQQPRVLYWGNDSCMFYNEAARFLVGEMHPSSLGNPMTKVWGGAMSSQLTGLLTAGIKRGKPMHNKGTELFIVRNGFSESCFYDFVFLPIPSPDGRFMGFVNEFTDTTMAVLQENRRVVCRQLIEGVTRATEVRHVWDILARVLEHSKDVAFAIVYAHDSPGTSTPAMDTSTMRAQLSFGIDVHSSVISPSIYDLIGEFSVNKVLVLDRSTDTLPSELEVTVSDLGVVRTSYVLPIDGLYGQRVSAVVVVGSSPVRAVDTSSIQFFGSLRDLLFKSTALLSLPAEQRRANELTTSLSYQLAAATIKAEESERNFTELVHHAPIGMCMDRGDGHPLYVNDVYLELLGTNRASFFDAARIGLAWRSGDFQLNADAIEKSWWTAVRSGETASFEICVGCNTAPRWFEIFVQQRCDENGVLVFIFSWLIDISARKAVESVVEERLAEAIENRRASENFIDMVRLILMKVCKSTSLTLSRYHTRCATHCPVFYSWPTAYR
jgi:PAS domain-containing protein